MVEASFLFCVRIRVKYLLYYAREFIYQGGN